MKTPTLMKLNHFYAADPLITIMLITIIKFLFLKFVCLVQSYPGSVNWFSEVTEIEGADIIGLDMKGKDEAGMVLA